MTPEQKTDALLAAAGWHICNMVDANIHVSRGIAIREFPLNIGYGIAVDLEQLVGEAAKWLDCAGQARLDIFWLKDGLLADSDHLTPLGVIAQEMVEDLEAALEHVQEEVL